MEHLLAALVSTTLVACAAGGMAGDDDPGPGPDARSIDARLVDAMALDGMTIDARPIDAMVDASGMVPNGLAAWYRFEETEGPLVIDATGHGHNGMISGSSQRMPGKVGMGLRLTTGFVRVPADPGIDFVTAGTVEVWLRVPPSTIGGGVFNVLSRGTGNNDNLVSFNSSCGNIQSIFQHTSSPPVGVTAPTTNCNHLVGDTWQHIAITNDDASAKVYLDGVEVASGPGGFLGAQTSDLIMGRREQGVFIIPDGTLDEVKWWTIARSAAEVCADAGGNMSGAICSIP